METQQQDKNNEILNFFIKKGFLLDKELLGFFANLGDNEIAEEILNRVFALSKTRIITKAMIAVHFNEVKPILVSLDNEKRSSVEGFFKSLPKTALEKKVEDKKDEKPVKKSTVPDFRILTSEITPYRKIEVKDFVTHFRNRYNVLKDFLKTRPGLPNLVSINKVAGSGEFSVIGIVTGKRITKNKNMLLEIEDLTGRITALVNQSKPEIFDKAKEILLDDVVGLRCSGSNEILFVNDVLFPEASVEEKRKLDEEVYAVFTSDMHIGSKQFLEENFVKFIEWLNSDDEKVKKIRYMFIVGDSIDGVGIFPGQQDLLEIEDIKEQYVKLASYLEKVPKHITIIMCPGQHDAVRVPEPQPPIDAEFAEPLTKLENLYLVSNPSLIEIGCTDKKDGMKVLMYHGASLHSWINEIEELRVINAHHCPARAVKYILQHRHLSPTHSATTYVPGEQEDAMVIKEIPDIITTGEVHKPDIDMYNNILIICNSCWQSITPYEEKVGNSPDPCKVPFLNLKTREIKILDFSDDADEAEKNEKGVDEEEVIEA